MNVLIGFGWMLVALVSTGFELSPRIPTDAIVAKLMLASTALFALYQAKQYLPL